jgi:hypothetical protein
MRGWSGSLSFMLCYAEAAGLDRGSISLAEKLVLPMWPRCYSPTCNHGMEGAADQWERSPCYSPCCTQVGVPGHHQACDTTLHLALHSLMGARFPDFSINANRCAPRLEECGVLRASVLACVLREQIQPQIVYVDVVLFDLTCVLRW